MANIEPSSDRRNSIRFTVKNGIVYLDKAKYFSGYLKKKAYAGDDLRKKISSLPMKIGNIVNISERGMAFHYFSVNDNIENLDVYSMSLKFKKAGMEMNKLSFVTKNDFAVSGDFLGLRQRCIQFGKMQAYTMSYLKFFLQTCQSKIATNTSTHINSFARHQ